MTDRGTALPEKIRRMTGMSPSQRARLDADAKAAAMKFAWAAKSRNAPAIAVITERMTRSDLIALALNLAEAISPGDNRLLEVTRVPGDGLPQHVTRRAPHGHAASPEGERTSARRSPVPVALRAVEGDSEDAA